MSYSGDDGSARQKLSGGSTVELGGDSRKLETGLLFMQTSGDVTLQDGSRSPVTNSYLAVPMMAKLRVAALRTQSWYAKFGVISAFSVGPSRTATANPIDLMGSAGLGGRFVFTPKADFIIEATYNRGVMDAVQSSSSVNYNQGFLVLVGLSFRI